MLNSTNRGEPEDENLHGNLVRCKWLLQIFICAAERRD